MGDLKLDVLCLAFINARHSGEFQNLSGLGIKDHLTEASLGWGYFGKYQKDRNFYTFNDKFVRDIIRRSKKGGKVSSLNRFFESSQCEENLNSIKKHLKINDNETWNLVDEYLKHINIKRDELKLEIRNGEKKLSTNN